MTVDYTFIRTLNFDFIDFLKFHFRPCKAKFIPSKVWTDLDKYRYRGEELRNYFKKWKTKVSFRKDKKATDLLLVGGEYDYDDDYMELQIYSAVPFNEHKFEDWQWDRFKYKIVQTMMHEFIHYVQFTNRDDPYRNYSISWKRSGKQRLDSEREYYSSIDEIQAYAHCVLLDFKTYATEESLGILLNRKTRNPSPTFRHILGTFRGSDLSTVRKLREHVLRWEKRYSNQLT
jgi:hypothetical protein